MLLTGSFTRKYSFGITAAGAISAGISVDPYFNYVSLLLHGNGTPGGSNNTFTDSSSNNFTVTRNGDVTQGAFSPYGLNYYSFAEGSSVGLQTPAGASVAVDNFSISGWFYITGNTGSNQHIIFIGYEGASRIAFFWNNGNLQYNVNGDGTSPTVVGGGAMPVGRWVYVVITRTGTSLTAYYDGVLKGTVTLSGTYGSTAAGRTIAIGGANIYTTDFRFDTVAHPDPTTVPTTPVMANPNTYVLVRQTANTVYDDSPNRFVLTPSSSFVSSNWTPYLISTPYSTGSNGGSAYFDGTGDFLTLPTNQAGLQFGSSDFTIEAWVYRISGTGNAFIFGGQSDLNTAAGSAYGFYVTSTATTSDVYIGSTGYGVTSPNAPVGQWSHVAMVRTGGTLSTYLNGIRVGTRSDLGSGALNNGATTYPPSIGAFATGGSALNGYISNLRVIKGSGGYNATSATITIPTTPLTAITNTSLLLNSTGGQIIDNAMRTDLVSVGNTQISAAQSKFGGTSILFDGSGDYLLIPANPQFNFFNSGDYTVEFWLRLNAYPASTKVATIFEFYIGGLNLFGFYVDDAGAFVFYQDVGTTFGAVVTGNGVAQLNQWQHLAVVQTGTLLKIFVDGIQQASATTPRAYPNGNCRLTIGFGFPNNPTSWVALNGYIDDFRVTKSIARYTANFTPPTAAYPDQGIAVDSSWSNVALMLHADYVANSVNNNTFLDSSGNNFTVTRAGNTTQGTFVPYGSNWSGYFDGSSFIQAPGSANWAFTGDFTIEAWVNISSARTGTNDFVIFRTWQSADVFQLMITGGSGVSGTNVSFYNQLTGFTLNGSFTFAKDIWYHVAVTRQSNLVRIFVNGTVLNSATGAGQFGRSNGGALEIGGSAYNTDEFIGYISNFRMVNGTSLYNANFTPPTAPLTPVLNTVVLTLQGNNYKDYGPNNVTFSSNGTPVIARYSPFVNSIIAPALPNVTWSTLFNGTSSYLSVPNNAVFNIMAGNYTIEFWLYIAADSAVDGDGVRRAAIINANYGGLAQNAWFVTVLGNASTTGTGIDVRYLNSTLDVAFVADINYTFAKSTWYHVAISRDATGVNFFVNGIGVTKNTNTIGTNTQTSFGTTYPVYVGANQGGASNFKWYLNGYISNLRVVNGTAVYTANFTPPTAPLTAISGTSLLTSQNSTFRDNSTNNFTITPTGNPIPSGVDPFTDANSGVITNYNTGGYGGSAFFDGTGDYLSVPTSTQFALSTSNFTIEVWAYFTSVASGQHITAFYTTGSGTNASLAIFTAATGTLNYYLSSNNSTWDIASGVLMGNIAVGSWYHVALVRNGNVFTPYINGVAGTTTTSSSAISGASLPINVGDNPGSTGPFRGYMSNFRVVIGTAVYTSRFNPPIAPLNAITNTKLLLNFTNSSLVDDSSNAVLEGAGSTAISFTQSKFGGASVYFNGSTAGLYGVNYLVPRLGGGDFTIEGWAIPDSDSTGSWKALLSTIRNEQNSIPGGGAIGGAGIGAWGGGGDETNGPTPTVVGGSGTLGTGGAGSTAALVTSNGGGGGGGGGGGYYGGGGGSGGGGWWGGDGGGGGGGSNYISGSFNSVINSDGTATITEPGGSSSTGHVGDGYARVTRVSTSTITNFAYTGALQTFTAPATETYRIELWGAQGGNTSLGGVTEGGRGAYVSGVITLSASQVLNIYVGGQAGYNGGGAGGASGSETGKTGGGATDVRSGGTALTDRILVAGGGGGAGGVGKNAYDGKSKYPGGPAGQNAFQTAADANANGSTPFGWVLLLDNTAKCFLGYFRDVAGNKYLLREVADPLTTTQWNHFALVRSGSTIKLFRNGVQTGSITIGSNLLFNNSNNILYVGCYRDDEGSKVNGLRAPFKGYIDEVRVTTGVARYISNFTAPTQPFTEGGVQTFLPPLPVADFTASPTTGTVPVAVTFTDTSTYTPTRWLWDYTTDGVVDSTVQNPTYTYSSAGTYNVTLTATNRTGSGTTTKTGYITAFVPAVVAATTAPYTEVDPYFNYTTLLLHGDGINGAQNNTFLDSSSNNFAITRNGEVTQGSLNPFGTNWSNLFNGSTDFLSLAGTSDFSIPTSTTPFTVECWLYPQGTGGGIFSEAFPGSGTIPIAINQGTITDMSGTTAGRYIGIGWFSGSAWTQAAIAGVEIALHTWTHLAVVFTGSTTKIYLNGIDVTKTSSPTPATTWGITGVAGDSWYIGRRWDTAGTPYFNGYISNFRFVVGTAVYTSNFTPSTSNLTAVTNTKLLTCQSGRFIDTNTQLAAKTITANGTPSVRPFSPFLTTTAYNLTTFGGSAYFDGTGDFLTIANNSAFQVGSGDFTVEFWMYLPSLPSAYKRIFSIVNTSVSTFNDESVELEISNTNFMSAGLFSGTTAYGITDSTTALVAGTWIHIALVRNGSTLTLYKNGTSVGTSNVGSVTANWTSNFVTIIGRWASNTTRDYFGYLSNLRFVKGTAVYTATFTPPAAPVTAITNTQLLTNFTNAAIADYSTDANLITVGNTSISTGVVKYGVGSIYFDGSGDYLQTPANPAYGFGTVDFTVECWIYLLANGASGGSTILDFRSAVTATPWTWFIKNTGSGNWLGAYTSFGATGVEARTAAIVLNTWTHVAASRYSGTWRLFVNGVSQPLTGSGYDGNLGSSNQLSIGGQVGGGGSFLNCYLDDLRITKGVARYTANFTPPTLALPDIGGQPPTPVDPYWNETVLLLHGDGATGTTAFTDSSSVPRIINVFGGTIISRQQSRFGLASAFFNGTNSYLTATSPNISGTWTVECWWYMTVGSVQQTIVHFNNGSNTGVHIWSNTSNRLVVDDGANAQTAFSTVSFNVGQWNHLAVVRNGATTTGYINGVVAGSNSFTPQTTSAISVGRYNSSPFYYLNGYLNDVRVTNGVARYTSAFTPPTTPYLVGSGDANYSSVSLLLQMYGSNIPDNNIFTDSSTNNFAVTRNGTPSQGSFGPYGSLWSVYFNGSTDYLTVPNNSAFLFGSNNFTIESWVYLVSLPGSNYSIAGIWNDASNRAWILYLDSTGAVGLSFNNNAFTFTTSAGAVRNGIWTHIAAVRNGSNFTIYINGINVTSGTNSTAVQSATAPLYIGANQDAGIVWRIYGWISGVRINNGAAIYTTNFTPSITPLTATVNTSLLTGQYRTFTDGSSNAFSITTAGSPAISGFCPWANYDDYTPNTIGASGLFNGSSGNYLSIARNSAFLPVANEDFTIEAWVYLTANPPADGAHILGLQESGIAADWILLVRQDLNVNFYLGIIGTGFINTTQAVKVNAWSHVAVSRSGTGSNNLKVFVDGIGQSFSTNSTTVGSGSYQLTLGADQNGDESLLTGYISDARIVKGTALYTTNFTPPTAPLTAITNTQLLLPFRGAGIYDNTGLNNLITVGSTQVTNNIRKFGTGAIYFDGSGDYLSVPYNPAHSFGTGDFTVECWIYIAGNSPLNGASIRSAAIASNIFSSGTATPGWNFSINGSASTTGTGLSFENRINSTTNTSVSSTTITISQQAWNHVAVVRIGTLTSFYLNGVFIGSGTLSNQSITSSNPLLIGYQNVPSFTQDFNGYICDLRITNGVGRYTTNFVPPITAYPNYGVLAVDPYFNYTPLVVHGNGGPGSVNNTFLDSSGNNYTITRVGDVSQGSFSPYDSLWSNYFDGTGDNLQVPSSTSFNFGTGDFTIELFANRSGAGTGDRFLVDRGNGASFLLRWNSTGNLQFYINSVLITNYAFAFNISQWYHIAVSRNGTTVRLFVDGVVVSSATSSATISSSDPVYIGSYSSGAQDNFNGYISNLRIVNGTALYTANFTPSTTPLTAVAGTSLLTCQSNRFIDNSTNAFTITRNGDAAVYTVSPFYLNTPYIPSYGGSAFFDGSGDYLRVPALATVLTTGQFTIECWVYRTGSVSGQADIVGTQAWSSGNNVGWFVTVLPAGAVGLYASNGTFNSNFQITQSANNSVPIGTWVHLAFTRDSGNVVRQFINGVIVNTTTYSGSLNQNFGGITPSSLNVGATFPVDGVANYFFPGYISDLRISNVTALYTAAFTPPVAPLTATAGVTAGVTTLLLGYTNASAIDSTITVDLGTASTAQITNIQSKFGTGALQFNGTSDYMLVSTGRNVVFGTGDFTVECWVYFTTLDTNSRNFLGGIGPTNGDWMFGKGGSTTNSLAWGRNHIAWDLESATLTWASQWYHVAASRVGGTLRLFRDGQLVASGANTTSYTIANSYYAIGGRQLNSGAATVGSFMAGYIDDARVTPGVGRYVYNFTPPTQPFPDVGGIGA